MTGFTGPSAPRADTALRKDGAKSCARTATGAIMEQHGPSLAHVRRRGHATPPGVDKDMTEHRDDAPSIRNQVPAADIRVIGTPLRPGARNDREQAVFCGTTDTCAITGTEDGNQHAALTLRDDIEQQAASGGSGEPELVPPYGNETDSGTPEHFHNHFTRRAFEAGSRFDCENPEHRA